ncbi:MAG: hypothetical protein KDH19_02810, partial [Geminicoccaceae bacterium]|nr:hypothetical protein [Geminicoccaceae bacterium]
MSRKLILALLASTSISLFASGKVSARGVDEVVRISPDNRSAEVEVIDAILGHIGRRTGSERVRMAIGRVPETGAITMSLDEILLELGVEDRPPVARADQPPPKPVREIFLGAGRLAGTGRSDRQSGLPVGYRNRVTQQPVMTTVPAMPTVPTVSAVPATTTAGTTPEDVPAS